MIYKVQYGTSVIRYSVSRSKRKTLAIEVHPDLLVKVVAPLKARLSDIQDKVFKRARWIKKQQQYFEQFLPRTPKREYVSGESHYYLGRKYMLKVRKSANLDVKLRGTEMIVTAPNPHDVSHVKRLLVNWYHQHALKKFNDTVAKSLTLFKNQDIVHPPLQIRRMPKRWGSCAPSGKLILNPEIIKAPSKCIEYVIIHELCHLVHHDHSRAFFRLQNAIMPDWGKWKLRLERILA